MTIRERIFTQGPLNPNAVFEEVRSPSTGEVLAEVEVANLEDVENAVEVAEKASKVWRRTPAHVRSEILLKAAAIADSRIEEMAQIISKENGKNINESRGEAGRSGEIIRLAAFEGAHLYGDTLPLDANKGTGLERIGFTLPQPVGVVVAISPFNYPALLVLHKIAPAIAAGNSVILKPARSTPLTALALAKCFEEAGLPEGVLTVLTGPGSNLGDRLVSHPKVRKVSFTGSTKIGEGITRIAGVKKLSLELGASSPVVVLSDADIDFAANAVSIGGYVNAGQVCISVQRVIVERSIRDQFLEALESKVRNLKTGDPLDADNNIGSLISVAEANRVARAIAEASDQGARLLIGGEQDGAFVTPAILADVSPEHSIAQDELFGPAVVISNAETDAAAIELANSTQYGLGAGVFTRDTDKAIQAMREIDAGIVHINWTPLWRADLMPYGGLKSSGIGKEGVRTTVQEMTESKTVIMHGRAW
jgi:acyl-CoA reductase-like NAD-dependent aldehyde dehydrogenase